MHEFVQPGQTTLSYCHSEYEPAEEVSPVEQDPRFNESLGRFGPKQTAVHPYDMLRLPLRYRNKSCENRSIQRTRPQPLSLHGPTSGIGIQKVP